MLISVIVPIYKIERYISRCIESILCQSYQKLEIILVDDGSPDECGAICDEYAMKDDRIIVIHKKNGGLSDARNAGLDAATGEYILFVDGDDYIDNDLIETAVPYLIEGYQSVSFGYYSEDESGQVLNEYIGKFDSTEFKSERDRLLFICNELTDYRIPWSAWSQFFSREIIEMHSLRFENNKEIFAEDLYFSLCYFPFVYKAIHIKKCLYHYLIRSDSIMGTDSLNCNIGRFEKLSVAVKEFYTRQQECSYMLKRYCLIYYKIMCYAVESSKELYSYYEIRSFRRKVILSEIKDMRYFKRSIRYAKRSKELLINNYSSRHSVEEKLSIYQYYADGIYAFLWIRNNLNTRMPGK